MIQLDLNCCPPCSSRNAGCNAGLRMMGNISKTSHLAHRPGFAKRPAVYDRAPGLGTRRVVHVHARLTRDVGKEKRLAEFRTVYDHAQWANHRSTWRYYRHFLGIFSSRIAKGLIWPLFTMLLLSSGIGLYETLRQAGCFISPSWPSLAVNTTMAFNLSSFALSLLLVFRTNASYGRFDEARKLWGSVVNRSRDLARQACNFFSKQERPALDAFARWGRAFPWVLKNHLREDKSLSADLQDILQPGELELVLQSAHAPNTVVQVLGEIVNRTPLTAAQRVRMDENLTSFSDCVGACERLLRTPIPVSYTRHTSRFLVIWLCLLPFTLWGQCGWGTVPASVVLAYVLLAIEEIGVQIEEPFVILPLEAISTIIATNVQQHVEIEGSIKSIVAAYAPEPSSAAPGDDLFATSNAALVAEHGMGQSGATPADARAMYVGSDTDGWLWVQTSSPDAAN